MHAEHRRGDDPGKAGERGTGREGRGEEPIRVHAERPEHFSVLDAGADEHADARPAVDHRHRGGERDAERHHEQAIDRIDTADQRDRPVEPGGRRERAHFASPNLSDDVDDHERDTDRQEDLVEVPPAEAPQEQRLEHEAEHAERKRRREHREPERTSGLDDGERDVRPEHVERAVREVDDIHHPEHEREARGENEKQGAERETVQRLLKYELGAHS